MATTTSTGGTISVPISSILEALGSTLTEAERTALLQKLIGFRIDEVQPGDLIRSTLFNQMLGDINDLALRVAALEAGTGETAGPIIDTLDPAVTVEVNGRLIVTGRNFDPEPRRNIVTIGDVEITQFREDSTPTLLAFNVPDRFTGLPASFPVRVEAHGRTSPAVPITIRPQQRVQEGNFVFGTPTVTVSPAGNVMTGSTVTLSWPIEARTRFDDTVTLSALVVQPQGTASEAVWRSHLIIQPGTTMPLPAGQTRPAGISVTVPSGATSVQLGLRAVSQDQQVTNASDLVTVDVGHAVETPSSDIELSFEIGGGDLVEGDVSIGGVSIPDGILVKIGGRGDLAFSARDMRPKAAGVPTATFEYSAQFEGLANGLVVGVPSPATSANVPAGDDRDFTLPLSTQAGAALNATARLKVTCRQTKTTGGLSAYQTFRTIPLRIVN
jgi:hypothetical protein